MQQFSCDTQLSMYYAMEQSDEKQTDLAAEVNNLRQHHIQDSLISTCRNNR